MPSFHDIDLMQHADGELDDAELEAELDRDPEARAKVDAIGHLGELVRGANELAADAVPDAKFAGIWREIDKLLENETAPAAVVVPPPIGPKQGWLARFFDRYRGHLMTGVVSAGVVAAIALVVRRGEEPTFTNSNTIDVRPVSLRSPIEIESLDTPDGTGTVLNLEDEDGHTTVIWVTPADTVEGI
ncbi:MAG: hypothetical protein H0T79_07020 [Deltaproteobacteria bacterium]|nr:hypothetical protein [Deltaproteobacteria bacterium]